MQDIPPIESEIARRGIHLRGRGPERCGPCPVCNGTDRFSINIRKQLWHCRGCQAGGDVIDLVQHIDRCDFRTAVRTLGMAPWPGRAAPALSSADNNGRRALGIWQTAQPIAGTLAEIYLRSRRLEYADPDGDVLRFHPQCPFGDVTHPCMIVAEGLHIAEGIETTLAAMAMDFRPAWALGCAAGIAKFPVLAGIDALTIIVDHDRPDSHGHQAGHDAARECARRWIEAGREVRNVVPHLMGTDMADVLLEDEVRHVA